MKGLLVKDFKLLMGQRQLFITMFFVVGIMVFAGQDFVFVLSYTTIMGVYLAIGTISYDEYNNGFSFLFTLPVTREGYVFEKYVLGLLTGVGSLIFVSVVGSMFFGMANGGEMPAELFPAVVGEMGAMGIMLSAMIPLQLKFGAEKSRIVMATFLAVLFSLVIVLGKTEKFLDLDFGWLGQISDVGWIGIGCILFVAALAASIRISIGIVKKKQF